MSSSACAGAKADGATGKDGDRIAEFYMGSFRAADARTQDIATHEDFFVRKARRHLCKIGHRVRNKDIFRLATVDEIAKAPATRHRPATLCTPTALTAVAGATWGDRATHYACPGL